MKDSKIPYIVISAWLLFIISSTILMLNVNFELLFLYVFYVVLGTTVLFMVRDDIFSPPGLFVLVGYFVFGLNIPFFSAGIIDGKAIASNPLFTGDSTTNNLAVFKVLSVFLTAQIGFLLGYILPLYNMIPIQKLIGANRKTKDVSILSFTLLVFVVIISGLIRIAFHLGEAGIQPIIPYAGILQYIFYHGVLLLCLWYLAQAIRRGWLHIMLGLVLLLGIALTQVLLSWRGGIMVIIISAFFVYWYSLNQGKRKYANIFVWLLLLLISAPLFIQAGNAIRSDRLGGESSFAFNAQSFILKVLNRGQGTTRLTVVVNDIGPLTLTNDFKIFDLASKGLSSTAYIDRKLYGVLPNQSHSIGTSGPGGAYIGMGLFGVLSSFCILGIIFRSSYEAMKKADKDNTLGIVWCSIIAYLLFGILSENYGMQALKTLIAIAVLIYIFSKTLLLKKY